MSIDRPDGGGVDPAAPDYELEKRREVGDRRSVTAMFHPLRSTVLDLLLERAATVNELAEAVGRPASTVAYHVGVLAEADLVRVVRTRRIRAVEERIYGRTARTFVVGAVEPGVDVHRTGANPLSEAAAEAGAAHRDDDLRAIHRHARVPADQLPAFWDRVLDLADEFASRQRVGDQTHAFVAAVYPADVPALPPPDAER